MTNDLDAVEDLTPPTPDMPRRRSDEPIRRCLSVVMPCYNERAHVAECVDRVLRSAYVAELVIVDDGSTDGTRDILAGISDPRVRVVLQPVNQGKGAALRTGFAAARADFVIVQDADLEYDPEEYASLLEPLIVLPGADRIGCCTSGTRSATRC
jgi:glycosyltransferase involved in cell wall biosynthesis